MTLAMAMPVNLVIFSKEMGISPSQFKRQYNEKSVPDRDEHTQTFQIGHRLDWLCFTA